MPNSVIGLRYRHAYGTYVEMNLTFSVFIVDVFSVTWMLLLKEIIGTRF